MNTTEELLKSTEEMAGLFFSPEEVAINLELNASETEDFIISVESKNTANPYAAAYLKGWLTADIELRKAIKQSAINGSSPAQQLILNFQRESRI
jgi:hypothetical protein